MAEQVLMTLGSFQFRLSTAAYESLKRTTDYRWKGQKRLGRPPSQQFIGKGDDKINLEGTIYPHFRGGLGQIDDMREMADEGEPLSLVDGRGNNLGRFCISKIQETQEALVLEGLPRKMTFKMDLVAYGEDDDNGGGGWWTAGGNN